jgi:hypothetical protein
MAAAPRLAAVKDRFLGLLGLGSGAGLFTRSRSQTELEEDEEVVQLQLGKQTWQAPRALRRGRVHPAAA